jgi:glycine/serine hydroxymethyltransferase
MGEDEMRTIGTAIVRAIRGREDHATLDGIRREMAAVAARFPVPGLERP